jgi:MazG family protein
MQEPSALGRIVNLVRDLRKRCPWDAAQTPQTLRPYFVEEAMELDHAIGTADGDEIREELGDVLLHVAFQIVLAEERGDFGSADLTEAVERKMWRRHPHLFAEDGTPIDEDIDAARVQKRWEATKRREKPPADTGVLAGIPPTLPSLIAAFRLQERAAGVGFDWADATGPLEKVHEELAELDEAVTADDQAATVDERLVVRRGQPVTQTGMGTERRPRTGQREVRTTFSGSRIAGGQAGRRPAYGRSHGAGSIVG